MAATSGAKAATHRDGVVGLTGWTRFTLELLAGAAALFGALLLLLLAVDPYDTGRTGLIARRGLQQQYPMTANASRARDPSFDAAVFGNSHVQMLNPERLDALTGLRFVSLIMPATHPPDHLDTLRWFLRNHPVPPRAIVLGVDQIYCGPDMSSTARFPVWLYGDSFLQYLGGLVRYRTFEIATARLKYLLRGKGGIRPDGFWDYGPVYDAQGLGTLDASHRKIAEPRPYVHNPAGPLPALARLRADLAAVPPDTAVILLRPPMYRTALPAPGTPEAATSERCEAGLASLAASRPNTRFVNLFGPGAFADNADGWYDHDHYRTAIALAIEPLVADALSELREGRSPPTQ